MAKKFQIQKDVEYKNGQVNTWYMIKLTDTETDKSQFVDCCKDDEEQANILFEKAVSSWVPDSKTIIKEVIVD